MISILVHFTSATDSKHCSSIYVPADISAYMLSRWKIYIKMSPIRTYAIRYDDCILTTVD